MGITKRLKTTEVLAGESCSFECILSHESPKERAKWTIGGKTVGSSGRFQAACQGRKYTLVVKEATPSDAGEVVFSVRGLTSKASLIVRGGHRCLCDLLLWSGSAKLRTLGSPAIARHQGSILCSPLAQDSVQLLPVF